MTEAECGGSELPTMAANQHHEAINAASVSAMLVSALDYWEKAGCDCCSPTILDDAIEAIGPDRPFWERMRKYAIELAATSQNVIEYWESEPPQDVPTVNQ